MERRELVSWMLPLLGLAFTVPELFKLADLPDRDWLLLGLFAAMSIVFAVRLGVLAWERRRRG